MSAPRELLLSDEQIELLRQTNRTIWEYGMGRSVSIWEHIDILKARLAELEQDAARLKAKLATLRGEVGYDAHEDDGGMLIFERKADGPYVLWGEVVAALEGA